jgi:hypothetical protein
MLFYEERASRAPVGVCQNYVQHPTTALASHLTVAVAAAAAAAAAAATAAAATVLPPCYTAASTVEAVLRVQVTVAAAATVHQVTHGQHCHG